MEKKDIEKSILDLDKEIKKIDAKKSKFMFYVIDTKGTPSGSLWYIYSIAHKISKMGYIVEMLHNENDFVGVKNWIGEEYANLKYNYGNRHCWAQGYYVSTVGLNKATRKKYIYVSIWCLYS